MDYDCIKAFDTYKVGDQITSQEYNSLPRQKRDNFRMTNRLDTPYITRADIETNETHFSKPSYDFDSGSNSSPSIDTGFDFGGGDFGGGGGGGDF